MIDGLEIKLGRLEVWGGSIHASLLIDGNGRGKVQLAVCADDRRVTVVILRLGPEQWGRLRTFVADVDREIERTWRRGTMEPWRQVEDNHRGPYR